MLTVMMSYSVSAVMLTLSLTRSGNALLTLSLPTLSLTLGPVRLGPVRMGPVRMGPVRLGPVRLGPTLSLTRTDAVADGR